MRLAWFVLLAACGGSPKSEPQQAGSPPAQTPPGQTAPAQTAPAQTPPVQTQPARTTSQSVAATVAVTPGKRAPYSCFSYSQRNSTVKRNACMRTEECGPYLDQAKQVGGIVQVSGCASVDALWCFHQSPTKTDAQGADVCQPSMDACKAERALLVKSGTSVDTDCAPR